MVCHVEYNVFGWLLLQEALFTAKESDEKCSNLTAEILTLKEKVLKFIIVIVVCYVAEKFESEYFHKHYESQQGFKLFHYPFVDSLLHGATWKIFTVEITF